MIQSLHTDVTIAFAKLETPSEFLVVNYGTPQGSILRPLFCILCSSDFYMFVNYYSCHLYANDSQTLYHLRLDVIQLGSMIINKCFENRTNVSDVYGLMINPDKFRFMLLGKNADGNMIVSIIISVQEKNIQIPARVPPKV